MQATGLGLVANLLQVPLEARRLGYNLRYVFRKFYPFFASAHSDCVTKRVNSKSK